MGKVIRSRQRQDEVGEVKLERLDSRSRRRGCYARGQRGYRSTRAKTNVKDFRVEQD